MGILFFLLGLIFVLAGVAALAFDLLYYLQTQEIAFATVQEIWILLLGTNSWSDNIAKVQQMIGNASWVSYGEPFSHSPAFAAPLALGIFFWLLAFVARKRKDNDY